MKFALVTVRVPDPATDVHHQAFAPVVTSLASALRALGHSVNVCHTEMDPTHPFWPPPDTVPILVNAPLLGYKDLNPPPIPDNAILYNWEAFESPLVQNMLPLFKARRVWDGFQENIASWRAIGVQAELVPFGWAPELQATRSQQVPMTEPEPPPLEWPDEEKDFDILFYGSVNPRRLLVLNRIQAMYGDDPSRLAFVLPSVPAYEQNLVAFLARSKVVLNLRFEDAYPTPTVRPLYAIANGCLVVTEPGHFGFRGGRIEAPLEDLAEEAVFWARQPARVRSAVSELGMVRFHEVKMKELVRHAVTELESR